MSSALTITYSIPTAAGTPAAAAGSDAPSADSPLGFLAALVQQLLARGTAAPAPDQAQGDAAVAPTADPTIPALFNFGLDLQAKAASPQAPGKALLQELTKDLDALKDQLDAGETPDPDLLKKLGEAADALTALIAPPVQAQPAPPAIDPTLALDPLKAIAAANPAAALPQLPDIPGLKKPAAAQQSLDQITQVLASLGFTAPTVSASATTGVSTDAGSDAIDSAAVPPAAGVGSSPATHASPPLPVLAQLADRLAEVGAAVAPLAPGIAQKLQALTQRLTAAEADPTLLAQLTTPADTAGTDLDQVVRALLDSKPAPTVPASPQLATTKLELPAEIAPATPKAKLEPKTQVAAPKPAGHTGARAALPAHVAETAAPKPQAEARIAAAATARVDDAAAAANSDTTQQAAAGIAGPSAAAPAAAPRIIPAAYQAASNPINMGQVAFEMVRQLHQGQSRFSIRIDPPELGRVDVKMHVDASGTVNARLTVERSETLDMFQRDRGALEKALTQAGLDSGKTNLEFSLKQQNNPFANMAGGDQRQQGGNAGFKFSAREDDATAVPAVTLYRGIASAGGVNLFV